MTPLAIKKDIYWVGAIDYESRDFHGYSRSPQGSTYNCYLVRDEKNVLFDTVKEEHLDTMLERLSAVVEPEKVDYIVANHLELDHSGALPRLIELCKPEAVLCSSLGKTSLLGHFGDQGWPLRVVKTGDTLPIGSRTVHFFEARMLHWPDSMFSYIPEDKLLISNDAFGQNIACTERFVAQQDRSMLLHAMREYYFNIILPYSSQVLKALDQVESMNLDIDMIAPDHGLIFQGAEEVSFALSTYRDFALQKPARRALIFYDTMWGSTESMAHWICQGLVEAGIPTTVMHLKQNHHSAVVTELARCGLIVAGSPTHNNTILPLMAGALTYIKGLRPQNRLAAAFGSYGWSGESPKIISKYFEEMGLSQPVEPLKTQYVPGEDTKKACREAGRELAAALETYCQEWVAPGPG